MPSVWPKSGRPYVSQLETDFRDDRIVLSTCFHNHPYFASFKHNLWKWAPIIINSRQLARSTIVLRAAKRQLLFLNLLWFLCVTQTIAVWWYYHHGRKDSWGFSDALAYLAGWLTGRLVELKIVSFNLYRLEWCLPDMVWSPLDQFSFSFILKYWKHKKGKLFLFCSLTWLYVERHSGG